MTIYYQKIKAIKIRVFKWKERMIHEQFSNCGLLQSCIINDIMHVKRRNHDFLEASRNFEILSLNPVLVDLPNSYKSSYPDWYRSFFKLLSEDNGHSLITPETAKLLANTISLFVTSNYHATQDSYSLGGERNYKVVVALKVYMKSFNDESVENETDSVCSLSNGYSMFKELICGDYYSLEHRKNIGPVHEFLLETDQKDEVLKDFMTIDEDSSLNLWHMLGDEKMIFSCLVEWLKKKPSLLSLNPEQDLGFEEVEPQLKMKKFDAGSDSYADASCAICLEELCEGDEVCVTPCSHIFHCYSIFSWLATQKMTCPMCRTLCSVTI